MMRFLRRLFRKSTDLHCSFCNKSQRDVLKLVAGPSVNICNECIAICSAVVAEDGKAEVAKALARGDAVSCLLCQETKTSHQSLHVPNRGAICFVCVSMIKVAAGPAWDFRVD